MSLTAIPPIPSRRNGCSGSWPRRTRRGRSCCCTIRHIRRRRSTDPIGWCSGRLPRGGKDLYPFELRPVPGSVVRYNRDYGAQLINATAQCLNLSFFSRADALIDSVTLRQ